MFQKNDNGDAPALYRIFGATPEDGEVVGQDAQTDFAILTVIGSGSQGRTHVSFEYAENGFDLPTPAIAVISASPHRSGPRRATTLISRTFVRSDSLGSIMPDMGGRGKGKK